MNLFKKKRSEQNTTENEHTKNLKGILAKTRKDLDTLNTNVMQLNYIAGSTGNAVTSVKSSINEISDGNGELSENIHEMRSITEEMSRGIENSMGYMEELSRSAEEMTDKNQKVLDIFEELVEENFVTSEGMKEVFENSRMANNAAEEILQAATLINEVANRTNLLSLNASIEAARAGEAGRGFAVVAQQIQELAAKSRAAADNIGEITKELGRCSSNSVSSIEKIRGTFAKQTENMQSTKELLRATAQNIDDVAKRVQFAEQNMNQLEESKNVIVHNMQELETLGTNTYDATELIVSDFEKVVKDANQMTRLAFDLSNISETLKSETKEYDPKERGSDGAQVEPVVLRVGCMPNYGSLCAVIAAVKLGYFEHEKIGIELHQFENGGQIINALQEGKLEVGYIGNGAHKRCIQGDAKIFLLSHISNAEAVIGSRKSGVRSLKALAGKRIGTVEGCASETILNLALESAGLTREDCTIVNGGPDEIVQWMASGELDACALWSPYTFFVEKKLGDDAVLLANNLKYSNRTASLSSWVTSEAYAKEHKDILVRFTRAMYRGMNFRALEENVKQTAAWVAAEIKADQDSVYAQRLDADWSAAGFVAVGAANGRLKQFYETQQREFLKNAEISQSVAPERYILFDVMVEAAK